MSKLNKILIAAASLVAVALVTAWVIRAGNAHVRWAPGIEPMDNKQQADSLYASQPKEAASLYEKFISENRSSKDPKMQDQVGRARLKLGYLHAKAG